MQFGQRDGTTQSKSRKLQFHLSYIPTIVSSRGPQIFQKSSDHLAVLGARWVTRIKFNEGPKILGAKVQKLFAQDFCKSDLHCTFYKFYFVLNCDLFNDAAKVES